MAAARLSSTLTLGRFSLSSWLKCSNIMGVYKRTICTINAPQLHHRGTQTKTDRTTTRVNNNLILQQAKQLIQAPFSTFAKQEAHCITSKISSFASGVRHLPTLNQLRSIKPRTKKMQPKPYIPRSEKVLLGPQRKGVCIKVFIRKPKKPNSAQRKCALLKLSNGKTISAYIPRERGQLQEHGVVLFEGGRVQDCPGIKYKIIRGKLDMN